jgi:hypothetical protein
MSDQTDVSIRYREDWVFVGLNLAVYPREDGTFSIGRRGGFDCRDVETGFANEQAAVDHAVWMAGQR